MLPWHYITFTNSWLAQENGWDLPYLSVLRGENNILFSLVDLWCSFLTQNGHYMACSLFVLVYIAIYTYARHVYCEENKFTTHWINNRIKKKILMQKMFLTWVSNRAYSLSLSVSRHECLCLFSQNRCDPAAERELLNYKNLECVQYNFLPCWHCYPRSKRLFRCAFLESHMWQLFIWIWL